MAMFVNVYHIFGLLILMQFEGHQFSRLLSPSDVRLAGGPVPYVGRVEVFYNGSWGTVCDDGFDNSEARVVCRMLGYHAQNVQAHGSATFGPGNGTIIIDDLQCRGNETTLSECPSSPWLTSDCGHGEDAGVNCKKGLLSPSDVRLAGGSVPYVGRVEVFYIDRWGTVCDDGFDNSEARVVCRMLGYHTQNVQAYGSATFGPGNGTIIIDDLQCRGNETTLSECQSSPWLTSNCGHREDAGVNCKKGLLSPSDVRLAGGPVPYVGRVEVFYNGNWGTVCDDGFDNSEARVVCRMLGYHTQNVQYYGLAGFGPGNGTIIIDDLQCRGNETTLSECPSSPWLTSNCRHGEDAGVDCKKGLLSPSDVRLAGGPVPYVGRVEVFYIDSWGTVCDDRFDNSEARVVCRMLGYHTQNVQSYGSATFGQGNGTIIIDDLQCRGNETTLTECPSSPWLTSDCGHGEDAGVNCKKATISHSEIRLANGSTPHAGRVEVFINGSWGTICDDDFDDNDAIVVCRMLGYSSQRIHGLTSAGFVAGAGPVILSNLRCSGGETTLSQCGSYYVPWLGHARGCGHSRDAGVDCEWLLSPSDVRLASGPVQYVGRVEVFYNGSWGTVCDDSFGNSEARVVCRMLGYHTQNVQAYGSGTFGPGNGTIIIDDLQCRGNETTLSECPSSPWLTSNCRHGEDAGVDCRKATISPSEIRLANGSTPHAGRVEVFINGSWGTICDDYFDDNYAIVVCRMLGYSSEHVHVFTSAGFGTGAGPVTLSNLRCSGGETTLSQCSSYYLPWLGHARGCGNSSDAGVDCQFCDTDTYGDKCNFTCGRCAKNGPCDRFNGSCGAEGCDAGWKGDTCHDACDNGTYGDNCHFTCGNCAKNGACDHIHGGCVDGCSSGWQGNTCHDACDNGTYGDNCHFTCGNCATNGTCDHIHGVCVDGCSSGWQGDACHDGADRRTSFSAVITAVGGSAAALIVIALVLGFVVLHRKGYSIRKPCCKKKDITHRDHTYENEVETEMLRHGDVHTGDATRDGSDAGPYETLGPRQGENASFYDELEQRGDVHTGDATLDGSDAGPYETLGPRQGENASLYDELKQRGKQINAPLFHMPLTPHAHHMPIPNVNVA